MLGREKPNEALEKIAEMAESVAVPLGLCVVAVKFGQSGKRRTVELTINRKDGAVSLDDCQNVSRGLEQMLDMQATTAAPLITGPYMLEVQSPGIDRLLKTDRELRAFVGRRVLIQTREPLADLGDSFVGTLSGVDGPVLTIAQAKTHAGKRKQTEAVREQLKIDLSKCTQVRLHSELLDKSSDHKN
jgi:ribosome maturation factor RimP